MKKFDMAITVPLGRWGMMRKNYLFSEKPEMVEELIRDGELNEYLQDIDRQAQERIDTIISQGVARRGITEELKARDQMEWVRQMNALRMAAEENVKDELIYC